MRDCCGEGPARPACLLRGRQIGTGAARTSRAAAVTCKRVGGKKQIADKMCQRSWYSLRWQCLDIGWAARTFCCVPERNLQYSIWDVDTKSAIRTFRSKLSLRGLMICCSKKALAARNAVPTHCFGETLGNTCVYIKALLYQLPQCLLEDTQQDENSFLGRCK